MRKREQAGKGVLSLLVRGDSVPDQISGGRPEWSGSGGLAVSRLALVHRDAFERIYLNGWRIAFGTWLALAHDRPTRSRTSNSRSPCTCSPRSPRRP